MGDARSIVPDRRLDEAVVAGGGERQGAFSLHGLNGVGDEVHEDLQQFIGFAADPKGGFVLRDDLDLIEDRRPAGHLDGLVQRAIEIDLADILLLGPPGEGVQAPHDVCDAPARRDDLFDIFTGHFGPALVSQDLRQSGDGIEGVVDFVRDARRQRPDGRELFSVDQLVAQVLLMLRQLPEQERRRPAHFFSAGWLMLEEKRLHGGIAGHVHDQVGAILVDEGERVACRADAEVPGQPQARRLGVDIGHADDLNVGTAGEQLNQSRPPSAAPHNDHADGRGGTVHGRLP